MCNTTAGLFSFSFYSLLPFLLSLLFLLSFFKQFKCPLFLSSKGKFVPAMDLHNLVYCKKVLGKDSVALIQSVQFSGRAVT